MKIHKILMSIHFRVNDIKVKHVLRKQKRNKKGIY